MAPYRARGEWKHTTYLDRSLEFEEDRLVDKDLAGFCAKELDLVFQELDRLAWSVASHCGGEIAGRSECPGGAEDVHVRRAINELAWKTATGRAVGAHLRADDL